MVPPAFLKRLSLWLALASAVSILLGIAISQILLAVALGVLLLSGLPLKWPRIALPLGLFLLWTLVALAFSPDPGFGMAQIRKFFVFLMMLVVFSSVTGVAQARWLVYAWMGVGTMTAGRGLLQYIRDVAAANAAHQDFYHFYVADRIRGFMSHWMTFSGQELFVLLLIAAYLLFAPGGKRRLWLWVPCALVVSLALELSQTRSVWLAAIAAGLYLLWHWRKWAALAMPVALVFVVLLGPAAIRQRARSIIQPESQTDSNTHRKVCWRTGWEMIKAHPIVGLGPDEIRKEKVFFAYLPADISRPLPDGYYGHLHNIYIQYAAERGIPATMFIVGALLMAWFDFRKALGRLAPGRSDLRFLLHSAIACIIGTLVSGVFEYNLNDTEVLTMFLAIMCLGYLAVAKTVEAGHSPVQERQAESVG
ncbi:MAG TPA: O-antigen ligase family protein [Bryobacteraceae bacterium]|nr:O-antigen ligase family protein [Bryobacteraceae bacterium]